MTETAPVRPGDPETIGAYQVQARLGEGGQGVVFLARDPSGRAVAVKTLHARFGGDAKARARFVREVETARRVASPGTARVLACDLDGTVPYVVSEFIDGPSLQRRVDHDGPVPEPELRDLAIGMITALAGVHAAGVVHRDLKPGNVLVAADGPRLVDFGIARALDATSTLTSQAIGTPAYMAPEQLGAGPIGPATDLFAWACTVVFAATGTPPFGADSVAATIARVLREPPAPHGLTGPLAATVDACLAKDPALRPTAGQIRDHLTTGAGPLTPPAAPVLPHPPAASVTFDPPAGGSAARPAPSRPPRPPRPWRNRTVVLAAAGAAVAVTAATAAVITLGTHGGGHPRATGTGRAAATPTGPATSGVTPSATPAGATRPSGPKRRTPIEPRTVLPRTTMGFTRYAIRRVACTYGAADAMLAALRAHPCHGPMTQALYLDAARTTKVTAAVLTFTDEDDSTAVGHAARSTDGFPIGTYPVPPSSSLPHIAPSTKTAGWIYHSPTYQYLTITEGYPAHGGTDIGPKDGPLNAATNQLGAAIGEKIIWAG